MPGTWEDETDERLVAAARDGDQSAFEVLVRRHRDVATRVAGRYFWDGAEAEDVAQEALVKAFLNLRKLKAGVPFRNWLIRIATNTSLDRLRHRRRRPELPLSRLGPDETARLEHLAQGAGEEDWKRSLARDEAREVLGRILPGISPKDQTVLYMLYAEERSVAEIAEILGWSQTNVKVRAFRARAHLRRALKEVLAQAGEAER
jgi:RNA polymerase sigma-70 factor, ECF subfamily